MTSLTFVTSRTVTRIVCRALQPPIMEVSPSRARV